MIKFQSPELSQEVIDVAWDVANASNKAFDDKKDAWVKLDEYTGTHEPNDSTRPVHDGLEKKWRSAEESWKVLCSMADLVMKREINNPFDKDHMSK
jgi:hypothetical protein